MDGSFGAVETFAVCVVPMPAAPVSISVHVMVGTMGSSQT